MNEQLQSKLAEILTAIQNAAKPAGDFALEQLPDIAQQYLLYGRVSSLIALALFLGMAVGAAYAAQAFMRRAIEAPRLSGVELAYGIGCVTAAAASVLTAIIFVSSISGALLVWFAPKVWLLKELASLLK